MTNYHKLQLYISIVQNINIKTNLFFNKRLIYQFNGYYIVYLIIN